MVWFRCSGGSGGSLKLRTASGAIASFETNLAALLNSLKCEINASQDLHGYDHPWSAGGGKNKLPKGENTTGSGVTFVVDDLGIQKANGTSEGTVFGKGGIFTLPAGSYILTGCPTNSNGITIDIRNQYGGSGIVPGGDSGSGLSFTLSETTTGYVNIRIPSGVTVTNLEFKPMIRLSSVADDTFAPYENICPIVGYSSLDLTRCGKNFWNVGLREGYIYNGRYYPSSSYWCTETNIAVLPNTTYTLQGASASDGQICFYDKDNVFIPNSAISARIGTFTTPNNAFYISVYNSISTLNEPKQLELGSQATAYAPYNGDTFTVQFGQTVYGGVYDKSGRLTIDTVKVVLDGTQPIGLANWNPNTNTRAWIYLLTTFPDLKDYEITDLNISSCKLKSDKLQTVTYQGANGIYSNDIPSISIVGGDYWSIVVRVNDTSLETDTAINNYLSQNPIEVCYELATPIEIDVSELSVDTIVGTNNVFHDGNGDTEVKYLYKA